MNEIFKIMLIGDVSTGKTSFLTQLIYQNAQKMPKPTTQLTFFTLRISNPQAIIQIWDTPGDQRFYYKAVSILDKFKSVLIFIDITNEHTLNRAKLIIDQLKVFSEIDIHIIESKIDIVEKMPYKRKVQKQQIESLCKSLNCYSFQYTQGDKLEEILEKIVEKKYTQEKKDKKGKFDKKGEKKIFSGNNTIRNGRIRQNQQTQINQNCDCSIF